MESVLTFAANYGVFLILAAAFFDELVLTGFVLQGYTLAGAIVGLYATGSITITEIVVTAIAGSYTASVINFTLGYHGRRVRYIENATSGPKALWLQEKLQKRGLFLFMLICRFITITRPIYAVFLGTIRVPLQKYLVYEFIVGVIWVLFWSMVVLFGTELLRTLTM